VRKVDNRHVISNIYRPTPDLPWRVVYTAEGIRCYFDIDTRSLDTSVTANGVTTNVVTTDVVPTQVVVTANVATTNVVPAQIIASAVVAPTVVAPTVHAPTVHAPTVHAPTAAHPKLDALNRSTDATTSVLNVDPTTANQGFCGCNALGQNTTTTLGADGKYHETVSPYSTNFVLSRKTAASMASSVSLSRSTVDVLSLLARDAAMRYPGVSDGLYTLDSVKRDRQFDGSLPWIRGQTIEMSFDGRMAPTFPKNTAEFCDRLLRDNPIVRFIDSKIPSIGQIVCAGGAVQRALLNQSNDEGDVDLFLVKGKIPVGELLRQILDVFKSSPEQQYFRYVRFARNFAAVTIEYDLRSPTGVVHACQPYSPIAPHWSCGVTETCAVCTYDTVEDLRTAHAMGYDCCNIERDEYYVRANAELLLAKKQAPPSGVLPPKMRKLQIVLREYSHISEILHGFDIGASAVGYQLDSKALYFTELSKFAYTYSINIFDNSRRSTTYESRLGKYFQRGFDIVLPEFDASAFHAERINQYANSIYPKIPGTFRCFINPSATIVATASHDIPFNINEIRGAFLGTNTDQSDYGDLEFDANADIRNYLELLRVAHYVGSRDAAKNNSTEERRLSNVKHSPTELNLVFYSRNSRDIIDGVLKLDHLAWLRRMFNDEIQMAGDVASCSHRLRQVPLFAHMQPQRCDQLYSLRNVDRPFLPA